MVNQMDAEFDRITRKEIPSQLATAFISLGYEARLLDVQNRKKLFEKKANQLKTDIETLTDSLMKLMIGEKVDRKGENGMIQTNKDPWERFAREGYVNSRLKANHKYTRDAILLVENRIKKLENKVATQQKIATLLCEIILFVKLIHFLSQHSKYRKQ